MECTCPQQQYTNTYGDGYTKLAAGRYLSANNTRYTSGFIIPTVASLSSEERTFPEETQTLHDKVSKGLEKYLQDAEQHQALEVNYFDDNTTGQNEESSPEDAEQTIQFSKDNQIPSTQAFTVDTKVVKNPPESLKSDTGHTSRQHTGAYRCRGKASAN